MNKELAPAPTYNHAHTYKRIILCIMLMSIVTKSRSTVYRMSEMYITTTTWERNKAIFAGNAWVGDSLVVALVRVRICISNYTTLSPCITG